jgi:hypothetical protein
MSITFYSAFHENTSPKGGIGASEDSNFPSDRKYIRGTLLEIVPSKRVDTAFPGNVTPPGIVSAYLSSLNCLQIARILALKKYLIKDGINASTLKPNKHKL